MSFWNLAVWGVYVVLCGGFSLYSIYLMMDDPASRWRTGQQIGVMVNAMQVAVGLLMLSVSSATSLSEERQRGSLDVLLTTPLPTRSIVWGKWWGSFRSVPPLLILPMAVCLAQATFHGRYWALPVLAALILAYGAAITSLGLALATWIPRQGRAVGLSVGIYAFLCIAWIPIAFILFGDGLGSLGPGVASASPIMGVGIFSEMITTDPQWSSNLVGQTLWVLFWTVANLGVAAALLLASFATFNRCLGRIDEPVLFDEEDFLPAGMPVAQSPKPAPADLLGSDA
jgi:ABC-type transport system involved in multi-copper enzyme maturation permease subunit